MTYTVEVKDEDGNVVASEEYENEDSLQTIATILIKGRKEYPDWATYQAGIANKTARLFGLAD